MYQQKHQGKRSEIIQIILPCSNWKMLLMKSARTDFPEVINAKV